MRSSSLLSRAFQGAALATVVVAIFLLFGGGPAARGYRWWLLPLILVPSAGALGGSVFHFTDGMRRQGGWRAVAAYTVSVLAYALLVALAFALGADGRS